MDLDPQIIWDRANAIPVKDAYLAGYSGIDRSYFSRIRSGALGFTLPQFQTLIRLFPKLEELKRRSEGIPVDWSDISGVKKMLGSLDNEARNPPQMPTATDFDLLARVRTSTDLKSVAEALGCSPSELLDRVNTANRRFAFQVTELNRWTQNGRDLTAILNGNKY
jgi:hypothetical protein